MIQLSFLVCFLSMLGLQTYEVPYADISNKVLSRSLDSYIEYIKKEKLDKHNKKVILLREEKLNDTTVIYLTCVDRIGIFFEEGTPDAYSKYRNKIVFIYNKNQRIENEKARFKTFYKQFEAFLIKDVTPEGNYLSTGDNGQWFEHIESWRIIVGLPNPKSIQHVFAFPTNKLYEDFKYSSDGHLLYKDGIFDYSAVAETLRPPKGFDFGLYLFESTSIPRDSIKKYQREDAFAIVVIDELGKIINVDTIKRVFPPHKKKIEKALKGMPAWSPGRIKGIGVKVRMSLHFY